MNISVYYTWLILYPLYRISLYLSAKQTAWKKEIHMCVLKYRCTVYYLS